MWQTHNLGVYVSCDIAQGRYFKPTESERDIASVFYWRLELELEDRTQWQL